MMSGVVYGKYPQRNRVAVQTDGHGFTVFECTDDTAFELGDKVRWENDTGMGGQVYVNETRQKRYSVFVQNHWVSREQLNHQMTM